MLGRIFLNFCKERRKDGVFLWDVEELTFLIRYRIMIPEFYVIQICKHWRSVAIGYTVKFSANHNSGTWIHQSDSPFGTYKLIQVI